VRRSRAQGRISEEDVYRWFLFGHGYDYRSTVTPWFRGLFAFSPAVSAIDNTPIIYQVHASAA